MVGTLSWWSTTGSCCEITLVNCEYTVSAVTVVLLPGRAMISTVEDAITGYHPVTGSGYLRTVSLSTNGVIAGSLLLTLCLDETLKLDADCS